jgi:hypothetical protein
MRNAVPILVASALVLAGPTSAVSHPCGSSDTPSEKRADVDKEGPSPIVIYVLEAKGSG